MSISTVELFTPDSNFWELNQQFKIANPFKTIYAKDKSKGKKESSKLMWFVAHCYDISSKFYRLPVEEKHKVISEDFCGDVNFYEDNKDLLNDLVEAFINLQDTPVQRAMRTLNKKLEERARLIDETEYTFDYYEEDDRGKLITKKGTADQLDKMMIATKKLIDYFQDIRKELATEETQGTAKGGSLSSLND
jgi:hypothetical protein